MLAIVIVGSLALELLLKVQSCKLYNIKFIIASTQITNTEIFAFIAVQVFKLLSDEILFINKRQWKLLKSRLLFKKKANFTGNLQQNYKQLKCEIFSVLLKQGRDYLSVLIRFT